MVAIIAAFVIEVMTQSSIAVVVEMRPRMAVHAPFAKELFATTLPCPAQTRQ
jgi:hypothetical protein